MKLSPATKAGQAYEKGKAAVLQGMTERDCPYLLGKVIHLKNWWMKGYNEAKTQTAQ